MVVIFSEGDVVFCFTYLDSHLTVPVGPAERKTMILGILLVIPEVDGEITPATFPNCATLNPLSD